MNILNFTVTIFYVLYYISFNFSPTKNYYTPNSSKYYEDSAELSSFLITALENDLQPRKPVHFFPPTLLCHCSEMTFCEEILLKPNHIYATMELNAKI